ncbi:hypothetical protein Kpol_534p37 [Vanderwaltozyma polyspora DSM 70294]|uniref:ABC1 atypical kinase-like domain-containing protein n=1 Tax=Vanderwaltozyma polyspora (strain ATCC 22028 / DSM 70294 / BCRC 21397 / CBS 2163 / NBRC 10782 / NRRL Y-8283 / UCD 57-17) TaxID=436907 RepID=A7TJL3_VANPO|nr:uncharacterized protein Kpol_534p37 [Vanderwaltozyma polyspora DSM 70294]EDO17556.1 hypothetical protein Kpol_534p37 [Vanderwaltozyma polyspora DSM 70294]
MSGTRETVYRVYCLWNSACGVIKGSSSIASQSLKSWVSTSTLTRPTLISLQCGNDSNWEQANALANSIREKRSAASNRKHNPKDFVNHNSTRHYSTARSIEKNANDVENQESTNEGKPEMQSSKVPSSRLSRLYHYGSLAANVGVNVAAQSLQEVAKGKSPNWKSLILSDSNIDKITKKFSKMRGAALKIGQMMSFQDENVLPRELYEILSRVQNSANYMPQRQLDRVLSRELGSEWRSKFKRFENIPIAAASIGQVHEAELLNGEKVVVKVQYPGVKESIDSDLSNMLMLLTASSLLPKGLFLDKTIENARRELKWECDYIREANAMKKFGELIKDDPVFEVPKVYDELTTESVLTMQRMEGTEIMKLPSTINQELRNFLGDNVMRLCLQEIATFKFMQTDPNWANFLYNDKTKKIELLDFGAARPYSEKFITNYRKLLTYASKSDYNGVYEISKELGFLNGLESKMMADAHVESITTLCEVFRGEPNVIYSFKDQTVSDRIREKIGLMLNERLCPPPDEVYSLHRKFSGVFLLCTRLNADVHCAKYFQEIFAYK